jgi:hypothetical protein
MRLIRLLMALARMRLGRWLIQSGAKLIEAGTWLIKFEGRAPARHVARLIETQVNQRDAEHLKPATTSGVVARCVAGKPRSDGFG